MSSDKTLVLVDGSALAFRSFYALFRTGMRTKSGQPTWAIYGFFNALFDILKTQKPDMMAVCFDLAEPTFRHIEYKEYKANRSEMPDDLAVQWPLIKEGVEAFDIPLYELAGFEADDVIGTVAHLAQKKGYKVEILTGDQDAFQLLNKQVSVLMPTSKGLLNYGRQEVFDKLGVWPEQVVDYKALSGDTSDNIPGVKGIGPKTASTLLAKFGTLEDLYEQIDQVDSKSVKQKLVDGKDSAFASKRLATIRCDVPLPFDFEHCHLSLPQIEKVQKYLQRLEFKSMLAQLPEALVPFNQGKPLEIVPEIISPSETEPSTTTLDKIATTSESKIITTEEDFAWLTKKLATQSIFAIDLETTGLDSLGCNIVGYALAWSDACVYKNGALEINSENWQTEQVYIPVSHFGEKQLDAEYVANGLKPFLEDGSIGKIAQNAKFEMNVLSLYGIKMHPLAYDTMLASYDFDPDGKHGLKDQSERLLGHTMTRIQDLIGTGRKQMTMDQLPIAKVAPYAIDDARVTLELTRYWHGILNEQQKKLLYEMDLPLVAVLAKMEQAGVALDTDYLRKISEQITKLLTVLEQEIFTLAGRPFNISSTQQLQTVLFDNLKLTPKVRTKSGYSTDAAVLESLKSEHEIISKILDFRQLAKLRSTYVDSLPRQVSERDHRLHGEFNQTGTSTGRLSSSNPNLQNIPIRTELGREIRRAFIPAKESWVIISADYSQIELRLLAHMCGDENLIEAFQKNEDIHARTAMGIFNVPIDQVTSDMRRVGKTINFSLIYQQGAYSTAQDLGISPKEAQAFMDKYFASYPKVNQYLKGSIEEARRKGYTETLWGRRRNFLHLNDRSDVVRKAEERAACNAPLQGSAADLMKLAMIRLDREMKAQKLSGMLILQVHDELVLEVPSAESEATQELVGQCMRLDDPLKVPLRVDIRVGNNWKEAK